MRLRCYYPSHKAYRRYGGRGVTVCNEWLLNFAAFSEWAKESGYRDGLTIDRINANGSYCPENCRWISLELNSAMHGSGLTTINGETKTLVEWAKHPKCSVSVGVIYVRLSKGWSHEDAFFRPHRKLKESLK